MFRANELTIETTNRCNLNCSFCYCDSNSNSNELTVDQIKKAINIVKPKSISFTGGEPTLRQDDIITLLPYAHQFTGDDFKGIRIETNGTQKIEFDKFVLNGKPKGIHFNISLDGFKELHESQRGLNTWDKVIDFTKESLQRGYWTTVKATMPDNIILNETEYLYDFAKFCASIGLPRIRIGHVKDSGRGARDDGGQEYKKIIEKMSMNIGKISSQIESDFNMNITDGRPYVVSAFCGGCNYNRKDLVLDVNGILRLECPFLHVPLCHYSKYNYKLHEMGLYLMKKNKMGIYLNKKFDMKSKRSVFD